MVTPNGISQVYQMGNTFNQNISQGLTIQGTCDIVTSFCFLDPSRQMPLEYIALINLLKYIYTNRKFTHFSSIYTVKYVCMYVLKFFNKNKKKFQPKVTPNSLFPRGWTFFIMKCSEQRTRSKQKSSSEEKPGEGRIIPGSWARLQSPCRPPPCHPGQGCIT